MQTMPSRLPAISPTQTKRKRGKARTLRRNRLYLKDPRCAKCRRPVLPDEFHMDHIVALVNGGRDVESNCQVLCHPCHEAKTREDLALAGRGGSKPY